MKIDEENIQRSPRLVNQGVSRNNTQVTAGYRRNMHQQHHQQQENEMNMENSVTKIQTTPTLSVTAVDVVVACQSSPSHSILTLTPGRTRNIDQDMEALRLSRQDNPFLQVLASRENLLETIESESDDTILMSQEFGDSDPLTLAQVHEHLVRSPPPASWSRSPIFQFSDQNTNSSSPKFTRHDLNESPKLENSTDSKDRHTHSFSLLNPTPIRSLSEVRRLHKSAEDSVQLMSSE